MRPAAREDVGTPEGHSNRLLSLARQLYDVLTDGAPPAGYHLQRGHALRDAQTKAPIPWSWTPTWQPARELHPDGTRSDRLLNPYVLLQHLRGHYDVAWTAPSWMSLLVLDIDRPALLDDADPSAILAANLERDSVLEAIWKAFGFDRDRQPVVLSTPGGGYHLYLPISRTRDPSARERTWPAAWARELLEHHLDRHGIDRRPGRLELYPSGVRLRAPCGRGMALLRPHNPAHGDDLQFEVLSARALELIDGKTGQRRTVVRRDVPSLTQAFLDALAAQRRPIEEWLHGEDTRPAWSTRWGPFGDRADPSSAKNPGSAIQVDSGSCQHTEDVYSSAGEDPQSGPAVSQAFRRLTRSLSPPSGLSLQTGASVGGRHGAPSSGPPPRSLQLCDRARGQLAGDLLEGPAFFEYVGRLWNEGIPEPGRRHDAALKLAWYFGAVCGYGRDEVLARISDWLHAHSHQSATLLKSPEKFYRETLREVANYFDSRVVHCRPIGNPRRIVDTLGRLLVEQDRALLSHIAHEARHAAEHVLRHLKAHADHSGRVAFPVHLPGSRLQAICGPARISIDGRSRRAYVVAVEELVRLGVLTLYQNYSVGHHGRRYCCWYQFGSGELPPEREDGRRVLAQRLVEEGSLRVLSEGTCAPVTVELEPAVPSPSPSSPFDESANKLDPDAVPAVSPHDLPDCPATALCTNREPWWIRMYQRRAFTPAEFLDRDQRRLLPGPFRHHWPKRTKVVTQTTSVNAEATNDNEVISTLSAPLGVDNELIPLQSPTAFSDRLIPVSPAEATSVNAEATNDNELIPIPASSADEAASLDDDDEHLIAHLPKDLRNAVRRMFASWRRTRGP